MVFNLYFDDKYFHWAFPLIKSIRIYEPTAKIFIHAYNLSTKQKSKIENLKVDAFECEYMLFNPKVSDAYHWKNPSTDQIQLRFQITCRKGEFLLKSMKKFPKESLHIIMDVDMILIRPLKNLKKQMKNHDIGMIKVDDSKIMGTFLVARSTNEGKHYLTNFNKQAMDGKLYLCKDQKTLAKVYLETKNTVKFLYLSRQYLDPTSTKEAYIWSAHKSKYGTKEERYEKYKNYMKNLNTPKTT